VQRLWGIGTGPTSPQHTHLAAAEEGDRQDQLLVEVIQEDCSGNCLQGRRSSVKASVGAAGGPAKQLGAGEGSAQQAQQGWHHQRGGDAVQQLQQGRQAR
jgi:hypothetical protein